MMSFNVLEKQRIYLTKFSDNNYIFLKPETKLYRNLYIYLVIKIKFARLLLFLYITYRL